MIPLLLARIRIPIPAELAGPLMVVGGIILLIILLVLMQGHWVRAGLAAQAALALLAAGALYWLTAMGRLDGRLLAWRAAQDAVLVGGALLGWKLRAKRFDLAAAAIGAAVYALCAPLIAGLLAASSTVATRRIVTAAVWALCLLGGVALLAARLKPGWAGALVGAAAGALVGSLLSAATAGTAPIARIVLASALHGLAPGAALALALRFVSRAARA